MVLQIQYDLKIEKNILHILGSYPVYFKKDNATQCLAHFARINNGLYVTLKH